MTKYADIIQPTVKLPISFPSTLKFFNEDSELSLNDNSYSNWKSLNKLAKLVYQPTTLKRSPRSLAPRKLVKPFCEFTFRRLVIDSLRELPINCFLSWLIAAVFLFLFPYFLRLWHLHKSCDSCRCLGQWILRREFCLCKKSSSEIVDLFVRNSSDVKARVFDALLSWQLKLRWTLERCKWNPFERPYNDLDS